MSRLTQPTPPALAPPALLRALNTVGLTGPYLRWRDAQVQEYADALQRYYLEAGKVDRITRGWGSIGAEPRDVWASDGRRTSKRARYLATSNPYARRAIDVLVDCVVGTGIRTQCQIEYSKDPTENERLNTRVEDRKKRWMEKAVRCYGSNPMHWYDGQALWLKSTARNGELLMHRLFEARDRDNPLQYEFIDADRLTDYRTTPGQGNEIFSGIELNDAGLPVAYHVETGAYRTKVVRIPASEMVHKFRIDEAGQMRGVTWLSAVIPSLFMLQDIHEYTLIRYKVQSAISVLISDNPKTGAPGPAAMGVPAPSGETTSRTSDSANQMFLEPGLIQKVGQGQVTAFTPAPTNDLDTMTRLVLRGIGVGFGLSYERVSGDYTQVSFAGGRLTENATKDHVNPVHAWTVRSLETEVHRDWIDAEQTWGNIPIPRRSTADLYAASFSKPQWRRGVNPVQEVTAAIKAMDAGISSLEDEIDAYGGDPMETLKKIAQTKKWAAKDLGLALYQALDMANIDTDMENTP